MTGIWNPSSIGSSNGIGRFYFGRETDDLNKTVVENNHKFHVDTVKNICYGWKATFVNQNGNNSICSKLKFHYSLFSLVFFYDLFS